MTTALEGLSNTFIEEVEAIQSIFGNSTIITQQRTTSQFSALLRLQDLPFSLRLSFPRSYPDRLPTLLGTNQPCLEVTEPVAKVLEAVQSYIQAFSLTSDVFLFELINTINDVWTQNRPSRDPINKNVGPEDNETSNPSGLVDVEALEKVESCTACLDELLVVDMVSLQCGHSYCIECLQCMLPMASNLFPFRADKIAVGLEAAITAKQVFTCCKERITTPILKKYTILPDGTLLSHGKTIAELETPNPLYCAYQDCLAFIPPTRPNTTYQPIEICPLCRRRTCWTCRKADHVDYFCGRDAKMQKLMRSLELLRCSKCHHYIEKNGGCKRMTCRCGRHFIWPTWITTE